MTENLCQLPSTGGIAGLLIAGLFILAGVAIVVAVRRSRLRLSVIAALPLMALIGVQAPTTTDPCAPATTIMPGSTTTTDATDATGGVPTSEVISELPDETTVPPTTSPATTAPDTSEPDATLANFGEI